MKITKDLLRKIIKEEILKEYGMEQDFQPGMRVGWNSLEKIIKNAETSSNIQ